MVALGVAVDAAQHRRPRPGEREVAAAAVDRRCRLSSTTSAPMPGSGNVAEPGFSGRRPGQRADHDRRPSRSATTCRRSGSGRRRCASWYHIHASGLIGSPTEPSSRSDDRSCLRGLLRAPLHERADRGRRRVEDRDAVLLDDRPPAVAAGRVGRALVHHRRGAVGERAVDDVAVAGDPADVGRAPVDVGRRGAGRRRTCA